MTDQARIECCWMDAACGTHCGAAAEWEILYGNESTDCTEACTKHVGELLQSGATHTVHEITND